MQTEVKVGFAVLLAAALLTVLLGRVGNFSRPDQEGTRLTVRFDNVAGLALKSPVQVAGVRVGEVARIVLTGGMAEVDLLLYPGIEVYAGAEAAIRATGLLGEKYLELVPGSPTGTRLASGDEVPQMEGGGDLDRLIGQLNRIAVDIREVATSVRELVAGDPGRSQLKEILANIHDFTETLNRRGPDILQRLDEIVARVDQGTGTLGKLVNDPAMYDELQLVVADLRTFVNQVNDSDGTVGRLIKDPTLYNRLNDAAEGVQGITTRLAEGQGSIGRLLTDDSTIESFNNALESVSQIGARITTLKTHVQFRTEYQTATSDNKGYFQVRLTPREGHSYVIEVADDPLGRVKQTTTTTVTGGGTTSATRFVSDRKLLVSALFDRRFGKFGVRGGLMESTAGGGVDYHLNDQITLLADLWDFNSARAGHDSPHLKLSARYRVGDYFFVQAGMDNLFNRDFDTPFVGGGLTFEDDDLKYLLGTAASAIK